MKKLFLLILITFSANLFAQQPTPWWLSLEQGKQQFRNGDFGGALMSFEDARRSRRAMYEQMERDFIQLLSVNEVRRIGDSLERVERYSIERRYTAATAALNELYYRFPNERFNNSASTALAAFDKLKNYPEAEFWIGEVYRIEGEFTLALTQYRRALGMREVFEDPGFAVTLQYSIAGVLRTRQEYTEMERTYLAIISENSTNRAGSLNVSTSFARSAMTRTLTEYGITRFMELYRYNNGTVERAHRLLGNYYVVQGRAAAEEQLMFAFLIQNTIIIEEVRRRQYNFTFTTLEALALEIERSPLLLSYIEEVEYYKTIYYFAASLYRNAKMPVARSLWTFLASQPQAGQWHSRAVSQLRNPRPEQIVELP